MESGMVVICKVRAQVMSRDEYTGGWLPLPIRGGAVCSVMLCKSTSFNTSLNSTCSQNNASGSNNFLSDSNSNQQNQQTRNTEYFIIGKRIEDDKNVLNCCIKRDFIYNKVMPTFHHWKTNNSKFGLIFTTATEARQFDKAIKEAFNNMFNNERENTFVYEQEYNEDEQIFMSLELPATTSSSNIVKSSSQNALTYLFSTQSSQHYEDSSCVNFTPNAKPLPSSTASPSGGLIKSPFGHQVYPTNNKPEYSYQNVNLDDFRKVSPKSTSKPFMPLFGSINNNNNLRKFMADKPPISLTDKKQGWKKSISSNNETHVAAADDLPVASGFHNKDTIHHPVKIPNGQKLQCKHCLQYYLPECSTGANLPGNRHFNSYRDQHSKIKKRLVTSSPTSTSPTNTNNSISSKKSGKAHEKDLFLSCINGVTCTSCARTIFMSRRNGKKDKKSATEESFCCSLAAASSSSSSYSSCPPTPPTSSNTLSSPSFASPHHRFHQTALPDGQQRHNNNNLTFNKADQDGHVCSKRPKKERKKCSASLLSFLLPCLLCIRPLKACHRKVHRRQKFCPSCCRSLSISSPDGHHIKNDHNMICPARKDENGHALKEKGFHEPM